MDDNAYGKSWLAGDDPHLCRGGKEFLVSGRSFGPIHRVQKKVRLRGLLCRFPGWKISSRGTQSVWCGDVADLAEPLCQLIEERVRASHLVATDDTILPLLSKGKTANARMWVYLGDDGSPHKLLDFTLDRGRDGPKHFLNTMCTR